MTFAAGLGVGRNNADPASLRLPTKAHSYRQKRDLCYQNGLRSRRLRRERIVHLLCRDLSSRGAIMKACWPVALAARVPLSAHADCVPPWRTQFACNIPERNARAEFCRIAEPNNHPA